MNMWLVLAVVVAAVGVPAYRSHRKDHRTVQPTPLAHLDWEWAPGKYRGGTVTEHQTTVQRSGDWLHAICSCGWRGTDFRLWNRHLVDGEIRQHERVVRAEGKNSIQEGVDEATDQGQTSDTQRNTR